MSYKTWLNVIRKSDDKEVFSEQVIGNNAEFSNEAWKLLNIGEEKGDVMDEDGCYKVPINPKAVQAALAVYYHEQLTLCYSVKHEKGIDKPAQTYSAVLCEDLQNSKSMFYRIPSWTTIGGYPAMHTMIDTLIRVYPTDEYYFTLSAG